MTTRRGFALLAVLWLIAALGIVAAVGLAAGRTGAQTTRNRILLTRASWAREACVAILMARFAEDSRAELAGLQVHALPPVDLGRGTWCRARLDDPGARINLNLADPGTLQGLFRDSDLASSLVAWRTQHGPLKDAAELRFVAGFDSGIAARFTDVVTTRGAGAVNLNAAPRMVLDAIPGLPREAIEVVVARRQTSRPIASLDEVIALTSRPTQALILHDYTGWLSRVRFAPAQIVAVVTGGVHGTPITSTATLTLVPVPKRMAVVRRESE
ncbi:MAG TPA: type II secretion system protein GspK [Gemmatimonadales bacterium]|nr:type II secretion system protein GspK [Gemmatimonadales bacterium]